MPLPEPDPRLLIPLGDAAVMLSVSESHLRRLIKAGDITAARIGSRVCIRRETLEAFVNGLPEVHRVTQAPALRSALNAYDGHSKTSASGKAPAATSARPLPTPPENASGRPGKAPAPAKGRTIWKAPE